MQGHVLFTKMRYVAGLQLVHEFQLLTVHE
jgi:hypothetical protein